MCFRASAEEAIRMLNGSQLGGKVKALVWFWLIDETLSVNLVHQVIMR